MALLRKPFCLFSLLILMTSLLFFGCEGSEPREQVDDTVRELSGQKNVERMKQMKEDIGVIREKQDDQAKQLEESGEK